MAALCHDIGHLPFSHANEDLLPDGWNHERLTATHITGSGMRSLWTEAPPLDSKHIAKLAIGQKHYAEHFPEEPPLTIAEALLSEIITGEAFGVDRIDYLLRDSLHAGVAYGRFDHHRLIDSLRILPAPGADADVVEPQLGVTAGGLQSAEALLLGRYFMFTQVYLHPVRRIYDLHLGEFLSNWLPGGKFKISPTQHLNITDAEVISALRSASHKAGAPGHEAARRIVDRCHFKAIWEHNQKDVQINADAGRVIYEAVCTKFKPESVRRPAPYPAKYATSDFPVQLRGNRVASAQELSEVLQRLPAITSDVVYVEPKIKAEAERWLLANLDDILTQAPVEGEE